MATQPEQPTSTTRGLPFDPKAAAEVREKRQKQEREQRRQELRIFGRQLDEEARRERFRRKRQQLDQIEACYRQRHQGRQRHDDE